MRGGSYQLVTFGCQMNVHDSEKIAGLLEALGYRPAERGKEADLYLFNTCCVRENPERRLFGRLRKLEEVKARRPRTIIGVCGCMVQQPHIQEQIRRDYPQVDLVFGTHNLHRLPELLTRAEQGERVIEVWPEAAEVVEDLPVRREGRLKAYVNISFGCDNYCSYCIVPYVRGRYRSRDFDRIVQEVAALAQEGYKEVTLLGQNVNAYGRDLPGRPEFADLLWALNAQPGLERIRFTTSHPRDVSPRLLEALQRAEKVCEHLHLPLQAGSDRILQAMNRGYTSADYLKLVERARAAVPDLALTTDLIVGFPGETEEDFAKTLEMVRRVEFDSAFTFLYSPRVGTPAAELPEQVEEEVKKERIYRLIQVQEEISRQKNEALVGSIQEVLVEGESRTNPRMLAGRTRTNKMVHLAGDKSLTGELVLVKITEARTWTLYGERVSAGQ